MRPTDVVDATINKKDQQENINKNTLLPSVNKLDDVAALEGKAEDKDASTTDEDPDEGSEETLEVLVDMHQRNPICMIKPILILNI